MGFSLMIKIMFVCHGNICRSPMAEFLFLDILKKRGLRDKFYISSSATSNEEIGNSVYTGTKKILDSLGISTKGKYAVQLTTSDGEKYDYFIGMDNRNIINIKAILDNSYHHKINKLLDYTNNPRDISDPWYSGNFELTYRDILEGCEAFLEFVLRENMLY